MTEFLNELAGLANLLAGTSHLTVVAGEPGSGWSINMNAGIISADSADLDTRAPDFCRGLITHEIGHHLITRFAGIFPDSRCNVAYHALTNVLEDIRLERYIGLRFPGTVEWSRMYNNELLQLTDARTRERFSEDAVGAFLLGIVNRAWWGVTPDCCHPEAIAAIEEVWPAVERIMVLHPPIQAPLDPEPWVAAYHATDLPALFAEEDEEAEPDAMEMAVRLAEFAVWQEIFQNILPTFERLLERHGGQSSFLAARMAEAFERMLSGMRANGVPGQAMAGLRRASGAGAGGDADAVPPQPGPEAYHEAVANHGAEIHRLREHLLEIIAIEGKLKFKGRHPTGSRVNIRLALQSEADSRLLSKTWRRPQVPKRPDPLVVLIVDTSGSMGGKNAAESFAGTVILREACRHVGIPLTIVRFGSSAHLVESWDDHASADNIPDICELLRTAGGTDMTSALRLARDHVAKSMHRDPVFLLVSDGEPNCQAGARQQIEAVLDAGHPLFGIGLGPDTKDLADLVPGASVEVLPKNFPEVLAAHLDTAIASLYR